MVDSEAGNKPTVQLSVENGNVFNLVGVAARALEEAGLYKEKQELTSRMWDCGSYDEVLQLIMEYVDVE